jgi:hypothetical protein
LTVLNTLGVRLDFAPPPSIKAAPQTPSKVKSPGRTVR